MHCNSVYGMWTHDWVKKYDVINWFSVNTDEEQIAAPEMVFIECNKCRLTMQ